jgi:hypothetical protein
MFMHTFDFTNQIASNTLARKKRLFGGSTLDSCDLPLQKRTSCPPVKKSSIFKKEA